MRIRIRFTHKTRGKHPVKVYRLFDEEQRIIVLSVAMRRAMI